MYFRKVARRRRRFKPFSEQLEDRRVLDGGSVTTHLPFPVDSVDLMIANDDSASMNDPIAESYPGGGPLPPSPDALGGLTGTGQPISSPVKPVTEPFPIERLNEEFLVFDDIGMKGQPDLVNDFGFQQLQRFTHWYFFDPSGTTEQPDLDRIAGYTSVMDPSQLFVINIEAWSVAPSAQEATIEKFRQVIETIREANPDLVLGIYLMPPVREYWIPVLQPYDSPAYDDWEASSAGLAPLAEMVDVILPSIYTFYPDYNDPEIPELSDPNHPSYVDRAAIEHARWKLYAQKNLLMAQSYGKPVISYVWPFYHGGGGSADPNSPDYRYWKFQPIGEEFWELILETAHQYSDSTIVWTGTDPWDESADWWSVTQDFMAKVASTKPSTESTISGVITGDLNDVVSGNLPKASINVLSVNDAPIAKNDEVALDGASVTLNVFADNGFGVDSDEDHAIDPTLITITSDVSGGSLVGDDGVYTYTPGPLFTGIDSFTYTVTDPEGAVSNTATVRILAPQPPVAGDDTILVNEDGNKFFSVLGNDYDPDDSISNSTITTGAPGDEPEMWGVSNGTLTLTGTTYLYQPNANFHGTDSFTYKLTDSLGGESNVATVTITVASVNDIPIARNDAFSIDEDTQTVIDVLADNGSGVDSDVEGAITLVELVNQPSLGTATLLANNQVQYTPNLNASGPDQFQYRVKDEDDAWSLPATVSITLNEINDLPVAEDDNLLVPIGVPISINLIADNGNGPDSDVDGTLDLNSLILTGAGPANGTVTPTSELGVFLYTPDVSVVTTTTDSFTYSIADNDGGVSSGLVSVEITSANIPPTAVDDELTMDEDSSITFDVLVDNVTLGTNADSDLDGSVQPTTVIAVAAPSDGMLFNLGNGSFTYTPPVDFVGTVTFPYTVEDDDGAASNQGIVTIHVTNTNDPPTAINDSVTAMEDVPLAIDVFADNGNGVDNDIDGSLAGSIVIPTPPNAGTVNVGPGEGVVTYTPPAEFSGSSISFTYTIQDSGGLLSDTATVSIVVLPVNDPPEAVPHAMATVEDTPVSIDVFSVNGSGAAPSDIDSSLDTDSANVVSPPSNGSVSKLANGMLQYHPDPDFHGFDAFSYRVSDSEGAWSPPQNIAVNVTSSNDNPTALDDAATTLPTTPITIQVLNDNGSGIDFDVDGQSVSLVGASVSVPANGTAIAIGNDSIEYTPNAGFFGSDTFIYQIEDGSGGISPAATVTVLVNSPPTANDDAAVTDEDTPVTIDVLQANGNGADSDPEQTLNAADVTIIGSPSNGTLTTDGADNWIYTPNADFAGPDTWTYQVADDESASSNTATVSVTVNPINDPPRPQPDAISVTEDLWVDFNVLADNQNDPNVDDADFDIDSAVDMTTVTVIQSPQHGQLDSMPDGEFRYTPVKNFTGIDTFTYTIKDVEGSESLPATVSITIKAANLAPLLRNDVVSTPEQTAVVLDVFANNGFGLDADVDGSIVPASIFQVTWPRAGTLSNFKDGRFRYTPQTGFEGIDRFTYFVVDDEGRPGHVYESLSESNGELDHRWTFPLNDHEADLFSVRGYHESQTEDFEFHYSTDDGTTWLPMDLPVGNTVARHTFSFPAGIAGDVMVRVVDTDPSASDVDLDAIHIDHMYIVTNAPVETGGPELTISDATVVEPTPGERYAEFVISRTGDLSTSASYTYETIAGSAVAEDDFTALPPRIALLEKDQAQQTIRVEIAADSELTPEGAETFQLMLSKPIGGILADSMGMATIPAHDVASVQSRNVFYHGSPADVANVNTAGEHLIATDKVPLMRGDTATHANYINYQHGITGIQLEIHDLGDAISLSASDFSFETGDDGTTWTTLAIAPTITATTDLPTAVTTVILTWADDTIENTWLRVQTLATPATGLLESDEFFLGHLGGETGNSTSQAVTDYADVQRIFGGMASAAGIESTTDINRDGQTDFQDTQAVFDNLFATLELISLETETSAARSLIDLADESPPLVVGALDHFLGAERELAGRLEAVDEVLADTTSRYERVS